MVSWSGDEEIATYGSVQGSNISVPPHEKNDFQSLLVDEKNKLWKESRRQLWMRTLLFLAAVVALICGAWHTSSTSGKSFSFDGSHEEYEYIIVGGGPAGILTATKLAKHLSTNEKVLLLESGTDSQASVLSSLTESHEESFPFLRNVDDLRLNKFDIPLLWSGIAGSRRETRGWAAHHWPIRRTLLARGLGGCGLHNAM